MREKVLKSDDISMAVFFEDFISVFETFHKGPFDYIVELFQAFTWLIDLMTILNHYLFAQRFLNLLDLVLL